MSPDGCRACIDGDDLGLDEPGGIGHEDFGYAASPASCEDCQICVASPLLARPHRNLLELGRVSLGHYLRTGVDVCWNRLPAGHLQRTINSHLADLGRELRD